jgi:hypothetical protein
MPQAWWIWRRFKQFIEDVVGHPDFELVVIVLVLTNCVCLAIHLPAEGDNLHNRILAKAGMYSVCPFVCPCVLSGFAIIIRVVRCTMYIDYTAPTLSILEISSHRT